MVALLIGTASANAHIRPKKLKVRPPTPAELTEGPYKGMKASRWYAKSSKARMSELMKQSLEKLSRPGARGAADIKQRPGMREVVGPAAPCSAQAPIFYVKCNLDAEGNVVGLAWGQTPEADASAMPPGAGSSAGSSPSTYPHARPSVARAPPAAVTRQPRSPSPPPLPPPAPSPALAPAPRPRPAPAPAPRPTPLPPSNPAPAPAQEKDVCPEPQRAVAILKTKPGATVDFLRIKSPDRATPSAGGASARPAVRAAAGHRLRGRLSIAGLRSAATIPAAVPADEETGRSEEDLAGIEPAPLSRASIDASDDYAPLPEEEEYATSTPPQDATAGVADRVRAAAAVGASPSGAVVASTQTVLDGTSAYGFWGLGYGENGGHNPLNLGIAIASVKYDEEDTIAVVQATSHAIGVFDESGGPLIDPVSLPAIFGPILPGAPTAAGSARAAAAQAASSAAVDFPNVHFDASSRRWVLTAAYSDAKWSADRPGVPLVAASVTEDPTGEWRVYALPNPGGIAGVTACDPETHYPVIYNTHSTLDGYGVYISGEMLCSAVAPGGQDSFAGAFIYAVPKAMLYDAKRKSPLPVAAYTDLQVKASADSLGGGATEWVQLQPARPATKADAAAAGAVFVSQNADEGGDYNTLAVIKLFDTQLLPRMTDVKTAPRLRARKIQKGINFSRPSSPMQIAQPKGAPVELEVAGAFRIPTATIANGQLYMAKPELNSPRDGFNLTASVNLPSIYWARIRADGALCAARARARSEVELLAKGVITAALPGEAPLALGLPAAAVDDAGRLHLAYACGSPAPRGAPLHPGACMTVVDPAASAAAVRQRVLHVQAGEGAVVDPYADGAIAWGLYGSAQHFNGELWYALPVARLGSTAAPAAGRNATAAAVPGAWVGAYDGVAGGAAASASRAARRLLQQQAQRQR